MKTLVPLAPGFEEIEAVTIIDILRRAGIEVISASFDGKTVSGSHNISILPDMNLNNVKSSEFGCIALPGGMPGSSNLMENKKVISLINEINNACGIVSAICAAPIVLGKAGVLKGRKAVCFPGFESQLTGAIISDAFIEADGRIVTGKGPGCAILFSLKLIELISGREISDKIKSSLQIC